MQIPRSSSPHFVRLRAARNDNGKGLSGASFDVAQDRPEDVAQDRREDAS